MKQDKILYGNITFGQLAHFIVEICGKDALVAGEYLSDAEINDAYKEKGSYQKFRYTDEHSIFGRVRRFFTDLEDEFEIEKIKSTQKASLDGEKFEEVECSMFQHFYRYIVWNFISSLGGRPFEESQNFLAKRAIDCLFWPVNGLLREYIVYCTGLNFTGVFTEFVSRSSKSLEEIYTMVSEKLEIPVTDSYQYVRRSLGRCKKENKNPPWEIFHALLKVAYNLDKEYVVILLDRSKFEFSTKRRIS